MLWRLGGPYGYFVKFAVLTGSLIHEVIYELFHLQMDRSHGLFFHE